MISSAIRTFYIFAAYLFFLLVSNCTSGERFTVSATTADTDVTSSSDTANPSDDSNSNSSSDTDTDSSSDTSVSSDANSSSNDSLPTSSSRYVAYSSAIYKDSVRLPLIGINWFGFETSDYAPHGLWQRHYTDMLDDIQSLGFNALRIPFCPGTLDTTKTPNAHTWLNPEFIGMNALELFDFFLNELNDRGVYFLLDHHRPDCSAISELWYTSSYSKESWIEDLVFVAQRYSNLEYFIGIDIKNEPHGTATWGTGDSSTDWNLAAEDAAHAIFEVNSDILIFVEGIQENDSCSSSSYGHWWGGNLEPIACTPLDIDPTRLVLSPHVYGPDVYDQSYFTSADFSHMPAIWDQHFGFAQNELGYTIAIGEFGGKYGEADSTDDNWQIEFVNYLIDNDICQFFYWSWNPNSGDTGGIVDNDWQTVKTAKYNNLKRVMDHCTIQ